MKTIKTKPPMGGTGKATVAEFLKRGLAMQQAVDGILSARLTPSN